MVTNLNLSNMADFLLHSGVRNTALWASVCIFTAVLIHWFARRRQGLEPGWALSAARPLIASKFLVALLLLGTVANVAHVAYKSYAAPFDLMQDVVSAQEFLDGRSLYPPNASELIAATLEAESQRFSLFHRWPSLHAREQRALELTGSFHWVQAHPPLMTLAIAPLVALLGIGGTCVAMTVLSLAALFGTLMLLARGLELKLTPWTSVFLAIAVLGWEPVLSTIRNGQTGVLLSCLIVAAWLQLRRGHPLSAGAALGVATCLKIYPGLLLVYLLFRHRRAFAAALCTVAALSLLPVVLAGPETYAEYFETARFVSAEYARDVGNLSLQSLLLRTLPGTEDQLRALYLILGSALVVATAWLVLRPVEKSHQLTSTCFDLEYSLFVALMPLLSPISWDHYLPILLLPLAVLGSRSLKRAATPTGALAFLGLLVVLCIPDATYLWFNANFGETVAPLWSTLFSAQLHTFALMALCLGIAVFVYRQREPRLIVHSEITVVRA